MTSSFVAKLEHGCVLTDADRAKLTEMTKFGRRVGPRREIISQGGTPENVHLVLEGFACRYKLLPGGQRQIMALLVPGDLCDLHVAILGPMDHAIGTITACTLVEIPRGVIDDLAANHPRITRALWWASLVDEAILRELIVSMGGRSAVAQLAHLLCELLFRLQVTGHADVYAYDLPLTQEDLANCLGLSLVHVNRSLQKLRTEGLITFKAQRLTVLNLSAMQELAQFDPDYLHLRMPPLAEITQP